MDIQVEAFATAPAEFHAGSWERVRSPAPNVCSSRSPPATPASCNRAMFDLDLAANSSNIKQDDSNSTPCVFPLLAQLHLPRLVKKWLRTCDLYCLQQRTVERAQ